MSHNSIKVNAQSPDATGAISQALNDLSDATISSASSGQALVYNGSAWINDTNPNTLGSVFLGEGASQAYSGSGASGVASGDVVSFYASSSALHNGLSATITTSAANWVSAVTLGAGEYKVTANVALSFSASGSVTYQIHQGGTAQGGTGFCAQDNLDCHNPAVAYVTITSGTSAIDVRLTSTGANINSVTNQGNRQAELGYMIIERVL